MKKKSLPLVALALLTPLSLQAETLFEYVFQTGKMANMPAGEVYEYQQTRIDPSQNIENEARNIKLTTFDEDLTLTLHEGSKTRKLGSYSKAVGNPLHMYFLEEIINDMQADTGGSPFYIRNRLKEALTTTEAKPEDCPNQAIGTCLVFQPFAEDEVRDKMQNFADLQITFQIDESNPLWIIGAQALDPEHPEDYEFSLELQ